MKPSRRAISGVLLFDKATGLSSNHALQQVKRLYQAEKTGHTGTLDPLASGLLPLMFGEATKFAADLIDASKTYRTTVRLGFASSTGDAEGLIAPVQGSVPLASITRTRAEAVCRQFVGEIQQVPPMFSALKKDGKPLYEYARGGVELDRQARTIQIHRLDVIDLAYSANGGEEECTLTLEVECSKGTYVRTLGEDLAKTLGTAGYLTALRRVAIGQLHVERAHTLESLKAMAQAQASMAELDSALFPVDSLLGGLPSIELNNEFARRFLHGQRLPLTGPLNRAGRVRVYGEASAQDVKNSPGGQGHVFLGTGNLETDGKGALLRPERLIQVNL
ncbi:MAG TPA: tRNA pseudouridine(55) synthase TruB [Limnobacter sp.]|nr:tRNA pseudouridine(55) synthase TruB [Limnobacter sp.]